MTRGGGPPLPDVPIMLCVGQGYIELTRPRTSLLALSSVLLTYVGLLKRKMSRTVLGPLCSFANVNGEEAVGRRVGPERTPVERHTRRMYERREETWRRLTRDRVAALIRLVLLCLVYGENGCRQGRPHPVTAKLLKKTLCKRIIPFIYRKLVFTMDEAYWPITLEQFEELDPYVEAHLLRTHRDHEWQTIRYFFKEVVRERQEEYKRLEELEREAMEVVRRVLGR